MYWCLGDTQSGRAGSFEGATGELHFAFNSKPSLSVTPIFGARFHCAFFWFSFPCAPNSCSVLAFIAGEGGAQLAKRWMDRPQHTYVSLSRLRGETTMWMCGRMGKRKEGNGDGKTKSCFHPLEANPSVHLSPSDKMGRLWCPVFLLHPSVV